MKRLPPWVFECQGKARPGDSAGMGTLHVWQRNLDRTATCKKCGTVLTVEEADDCFTDHK
jgi:hypothetical protein